MKKKANVVFFAVFVLFLCFVSGLLIGRHTGSSQVRMNHNRTTSIEATAIQPNNSTDDFGKIDINTASVTLLQSLPNIGETLARRIVEYRENNGGFSNVEDLLMVKGIGQSRLDEIRQYITVGG